MVYNICYLYLWAYNNINRYILMVSIPRICLNNIYIYIYIYINIYILEICRIGNKYLKMSLHLM